MSGGNAAPLRWPAVLLVLGTMAVSWLTILTVTVGCGAPFEAHLATGGSARDRFCDLYSAAPARNWMLLPPLGPSALIAVSYVTAARGIKHRARWWLVFGAAAVLVLVVVIHATAALLPDDGGPRDLV